MGEARDDRRGGRGRLGEIDAGHRRGQNRHRHRGGARHRPRHRHAAGRRGRAASSSATSARASRAPATTPGRRRMWSPRSKKAGGKAVASTLSIAEPKNAEQIVKPALDAFGRVDILVNNAGILRDVIFHKMSHSDWSDVIAVHLNGSFNMSRAVAGPFREQNSGTFVHMTSTSGLIGNFGQANYMAAKLGIMGLSRGIALDMAALQGALELHRAVCLDAHDRVDPGADRSREAAHRALGADDAGKDRAACGLSRFRCRRRRLRANLLGAQQRDFPVQPAAADPRHPPLRGLDAGTVAEQLKGAFGPSLTPLDRSGDVFSWDPI